MKKVADCAILNFWYGNVHGAILTAYALQKVLEELGYSSVLINTMPESYSNERKGGISEKFEKKYLKSTKTVYSIDSIDELNGKFNYFITGSDQVFRAEWIDDRYFLDFVNLKTPKIAVSASFGIDQMRAYKVRRKKIGFLLNRFNSISVREESGIDICKDIAGVKADWIADPVFMVSTDAFLKLISKPQGDEKYCCCYLRDYDEKKISAVERISNDKNCKLVFITETTEVESFISLIKFAEFLVTDSFHGLCFGLILNTPIFCYYNELRGNERIKSLIKMFGLPKEAFIMDNMIDLLSVEPIKDFSKFNEMKKIVSENGRQWIKQALKSSTDNIEYGRLIYKFIIYRIYSILGTIRERMHLKK